MPWTNAKTAQRISRTWHRRTTYNTSCASFDRLAAPKNNQCRPYKRMNTWRHQKRKETPAPPPPPFLQTPKFWRCIKILSHCRICICFLQSCRWRKEWRWWWRCLYYIHECIDRWRWWQFVVITSWLTSSCYIRSIIIGGSSHGATGNDTFLE